jgi:hypothetical protein
MSLESPDVEAWIRAGGARERRWRMVITLIVLAAVLTGITGLVAISANAIEVAADRATRVLLDEGMRDVRLGGFDLMACESGERSRHFQAMRADRRVEGTVCCGLTGIGKACTLRWESGGSR